MQDDERQDWKTLSVDGAVNDNSDRRLVATGSSWFQRRDIQRLSRICNDGTCIRKGSWIRSLRKCLMEHPVTVTRRSKSFD